jgi:hypothetical protein
MSYASTSTGTQPLGGSRKGKPYKITQGYAVGVRRHQKRRPEPARQRQLAGMHNRAGGRRAGGRSRRTGRCTPCSPAAKLGPRRNPGRQTWNSINDRGNRG